jgi:hypothetical protein
MWSDESLRVFGFTSSSSMHNGEKGKFRGSPWPLSGCPKGQAGQPRNSLKAVSGVARPQGVEGSGRAGPGETLGNLGLYCRPMGRSGVEYGCRPPALLAGCKMAMRPFQGWPASRA